MSEPKFPKSERRMTKEAYYAFGRALSLERKGFKFRGLEKAAYAKLKEDDEQCPGFVTPIDELIAKFEAQGMKVVLSGHAKSCNVFILPVGSNNVEMDSVLPKSLRLSEDMDPRLKKLIEWDKAGKQLN